MKKALIAIVLFLSCLFSGCGKEADLPETASVYSVSQWQMNYDTGETDIAATFLSLPSKELCVIPTQEANDSNTAITAKAAVLIDVTNEEALFAGNVYTTLYPASITKLMTALLVLQTCDLNDTVTVSYNASHIGVPGAKLCGFEEGDRILVDAILTSLLVYSGNDAGIALAEHVAGSEEAFVAKMNEEAKRLGAVDTHFCNSHGLHETEHVTTAYDIYLIMNELLQYPKFFSIIGLDSYTAVYQNASGETVEKTFKSTNRFFTGEEEIPEGITVLGGKTGTTYSAGYCLALYLKDDKGNRYIAEVLKADSTDSLYAQMRALLEMIP